MRLFIVYLPYAKSTGSKKNKNNCQMAEKNIRRKTRRKTLNKTPSKTPGKNLGKKRLP